MLRVSVLRDSSSPSPSDPTVKAMRSSQEHGASAPRSLRRLTELPVRVVQLSDEQALEWQLIENSQRVDVHPYEEAQGFQRLLDLPGYDVAALAEKTGKSDSLIYARLLCFNSSPKLPRHFNKSASPPATPT